MSIVDQIAQQNAIRAKNGFEPMPDPTKIAGFEDDAPPPPPPLVPQEWLDPSDDLDGFADPPPTPSPLVAAGMAPAPAPTPTPRPDPLASLSVSLLVVDGAAEYMGTRVTLTVEDQGAIAAVVLKRAAQDTADKLKNLRSTKPKRAYSRAPKAPTPEPTVPRRRGRPKKVVA